MTQVIDLQKGRLRLAVKKGFRNWESQFEESFGPETKLSMLSTKTISYLAQGKDKGTFYLYDLIMNLENLGSAFEFEELDSKAKMAVIDRYLFLLDRIRFECMRRLGWLESYPGENHTLVELITEFERLAPSLHAKVPKLSKDHPAYGHFASLNSFDQETLVRKLIPKALREIQDSSETL